MDGKIDAILRERFGKDSLIAVATVDGSGTPWVRTVDAIYRDGAFYTVTHDLTNKMKHIRQNPAVGVCGEWFSGHGTGESLGYIRAEKNQPIAEELRKAFAAWYDNGHTDESDVNTVILKITVTDGVLFQDGERFEFHG